MKKITLLLLGIGLVFLSNAQSHKFLPKTKTQDVLSNKNAAGELVKNHINKYLKNQYSASANKTANAGDIPTLDSIFVENYQFGDSDFETDRFEYNDKGLNTYFSQDFYSPAYDDLIYNWSEKYFYNADGSNDYRTYWFGDNESGLEEYSRITYKYNDDLMVDTIIYSELMIDLTIVTTGVIEYNQNNQVSSTVVWYDRADGSKAKVTQENYYYNSSNSQIERIETLANYDGDSMNISLLTSFSYNGDRLSEVSEISYYNDGEIADMFTESFIYNENNVPYEWHIMLGGSGYEQEIKYEVVYENNDEVIQPILFQEQLHLNLLNFGRLGKFNLFEKVDGEWKDVGYINFYYSDSLYATSIVNKPISNSLNIYPNPAKNMITINVPYEGSCEVNFYDLSGKIVMQTLNSTENIDISNLKEGYYLVQVTSNGKVLGNSKLIKN